MADNQLFTVISPGPLQQVVSVKCQAASHIPNLLFTFTKNSGDRWPAGQVIASKTSIIQHADCCFQRKNRDSQAFWKKAAATRKRRLPELGRFQQSGFERINEAKLLGPG